MRVIFIALTQALNPFANYCESDKGVLIPKSLSESREQTRTKKREERLKRTCDRCGHLRKIYLLSPDGRDYSGFDKLCAKCVQQVADEKLEDDEDTERIEEGSPS